MAYTACSNGICKEHEIKIDMPATFGNRSGRYFPVSTRQITHMVEELFQAFWQEYPKRDGCIKLVMILQ